MSYEVVDLGGRIITDTTPVAAGPRGPAGSVDTVNGKPGPAVVLNAKDIGTWAAINAQTVTAFTVATADNQTLITLTNAAAITVTLPSSLAAGTRVDFVVLGAGMVTFVAGTGATLVATPSAVTRATGSAVSAIKLTATQWLVTGDLA